MVCHFYNNKKWPSKKDKDFGHNLGFVARRHHFHQQKEWAAIRAATIVLSSTTLQKRLSAGNYVRGWPNSVSAGANWCHTFSVAVEHRRSRLHVQIRNLGNQVLRQPWHVCHVGNDCTSERAQAKLRRIFVPSNDGSYSRETLYDISNEMCNIKIDAQMVQEKMWRKQGPSLQ